MTATVTVHAAGVWAGAAPGAPVLRPLRGSHLVFARRGRAAADAASPGCIRAIAGRCSPTSGKARCWSARPTSTIRLADVPPTISPAEADYLVEALRLPFPQLRLDAAQALSAFAGLRAIVVPPGEAHLPPSAMGRDSALWTRPGLVGITGGKLTTHRASAAEVLREVEAQGLRLAPEPAPSPRLAATRLQGRLGVAGAAWVAARPAEEQAAAGRHALQPGRAALVDARGAGAASRRPADAPHPARPGRGARRRVAAADARGAVPRGPRLGRGALGRRGRAPSRKLGSRGTRRPQRISAHDGRPAARHRRRHAERARPRLRPRREDARPRAGAVRAAVRLAAAGLGREGRRVVLAGPGRGLSRSLAAGRRRRRRGSPAWPSPPSAAPSSARARTARRCGRRSSGPTSASAPRRRRSARSGPPCSASPAPAS